MNKKIRSLSVLGSYTAVAAFAIGGMLTLSNPAHAAAGKACYEEFSAAKKAGKLTEKNFKEFKAAHCNEKAAATMNKPAAENKQKEEKVAPAEATKTPATPAKKEVADKSPAITGDVVFPNQIDALFAKEKEGAARMHTCQKQYNDNKATNKNGGLKWIQKGGGYYSECNKHLKTLQK